MNRERGQALVEAVVAMPACIACILVIADCGVLVRDRISTTQAATRAAEARIAGTSELEAARSAVPETLRDAVLVDATDDRIVVTLRSRAGVARLGGPRVQHRSSVEVAR